MRAAGQTEGVHHTLDLLTLHIRAGILQVHLLTMREQKVWGVPDAASGSCCRL